MSTTQRALDNTGKVRDVIDKWFAALKDKDAAELLSLYADDAVVFPPVGQMVVSGRKELQKTVHEWLKQFDGPITAKNKQLDIVAGETTAFAYMVTRFTGKSPDGKPIDMTARATVGFERRLNHWVATHEHASFLAMDPSSLPRPNVQ